MAKKGNKKKKEDFKKVKLKVGRTLKKTQSTDTTVHARKVCLPGQLPSRYLDTTFSIDHQPLSHRKLSFHELVQQLGHFNKNMRKDALMGLKQLLTEHRELLLPNLRSLLPSVARLVTDDQCAPAQPPVLRALLDLVCRSVDSGAMRPHFALLVAHLSLGLSHLSASIKLFALGCVDMLFNFYPDLCLSSGDLFSAYLSFLSIEGKKANASDRRNVLESLLRFLRVFVRSEDKESRMECGRRLEICVERGGTSSYEVSLLVQRPDRGPFDLPLWTMDSQKSASPLDSCVGLTRTWECTCTFLLNLLLESATAEDTVDLTLVANTLKALDLIAERTTTIRPSFSSEDWSSVSGRVRDCWTKSCRRRVCQVLPLAGRQGDMCNRLLSSLIAKMDILSRPK